MLKDEELFELLSQELASHRAIPFFGAGCSNSILPDWDEIIHDLCLTGDIEATTNHLLTAQKFEEKLGRNALLQFLSDKLLVNDVKESDVPVYSVLLSMDLGWYYTTNQDNVFEQMADAVGRSIERIVTIQDFAQRDPRNPALYKFHGDFTVPESVIFSERDYATRIQETFNNPFDIRLRSDALGKSLVFFGYSFRDPNIQKIFEELKAVFGENLPPAILIDYNGDNEASKEMEHQYGVRSLAPIRLYQNDQNICTKWDAYQKFLTELSSAVIGKKQTSEIQELFSDGGGNHPAKVLLGAELKLLEQNVKDEEIALSDFIAQFRTKCDMARIPTEFSSALLEVYATIAKRVTTQHEAMEMMHARTWLELPESMDRVYAYAYSLTGYNVFPADERDPIAYFSNHPPFDEPSYLPSLGFAWAIKHLTDWERKIEPGMYTAISMNSSVFVTEDEMPDSVASEVKSIFYSAYRKGKTTYENPLRYAERTKGFGRSFLPRSANSITQRILDDMPKKSNRTKTD